YVYFPYQSLGLGSVQVDRQQSVFQFRADYAHSIRQHETTLKLPRSYAPMEVLALRIVVLATPNHQLVFLGGDLQVGFGKACDGQRYPQPLRAALVPGQSFYVVGRIAVPGLGQTLEGFFHGVKAQQKGTGKRRHSRHAVLLRATLTGKTRLAFFPSLLIWSTGRSSSSLDRTCSTSGFQPNSTFRTRTCDAHQPQDHHRY